MALEARIMEHVRAHGYPVPAIEELSDDGADLVMERLDGPSMVAAIERRPWTIRQQGSVLGALHRQLHEIPPPDWLADAAFGSGDRLLHLDLHPLNVIISANGPIVIDWPNARRGDADADVALTWVLLAAGQLPMSRVKGAVMGRARGVLINAFLARIDRAAAAAQLEAVVAWKVKDPHISEAEQARMWDLVRASS